MTTKINVSGVWKTPTPKINVAGTWKEPDTIKINVAGTWKEVYSSGPSVNMRADGRLNTRLNATCYSGQAFYTTGFEYEYNEVGSVTNSFSYTSDSPSDIWVMWTRTGGTLSDWNSLGSGTNNIRYQVSSNRLWRCLRSATGYSDIIGYWRAYDAATGGNLLDTGPSSTWRATYEFEACPLCCFTPDTLVTLASGLEVPIGQIRKGDKILIKRPETGEQTWERVGEVITRQRRNMYAVYFSDGTHFIVSDDHPLSVEGKGYAAINPMYDYKSLGLHEQETLEVGDRVTTIDGSPSTVINIRPVDYPGTVFTLSNSFWFANGKLVL